MRYRIIQKRILRYFYVAIQRVDDFYRIVYFVRITYKELLTLQIELLEKELDILKRTVLSIGAMASSLNFDGTEELLNI